ncbi:MAG: phenylalanine--tRNA ligase subunit beta [Pseudomonadota bacterium]|nr:phenylalanine--tRNA ligase subunit beta [Pseudomonadota bacterium]
MALILSPKWLESIVGSSFDLEQAADNLSQLGLETELITASTKEINSVITGKVISTKQHPDADRLKVCEVDVNLPKPLTIVCGCPTVAPEMIVAVAVDGASLPSMKIKASKLRGVQSEGMLCTAYELGMSSLKHSLLSLPKDTNLGIPVSDLLALDQTWMEVEITPNRGDCVSALGVAREIAISLNSEIRKDFKLLATDEDKLLGNVDLSCHSYAYAQIEIEVDAQTMISEHIDYQLHVSGLNRVNNIVDVLNYVMLYTGQPMHAFDFDKIKGTVSVRYAKKGESIVLLDEQQIALETSDLVIADDSGPIALAGIMGGAHSKVTAESKSLFIESACFDPTVIAKTAKRIGLNTDASYRYVRGTDPEMVETALSIAVQDIQDIYQTKINVIGAKANKQDREPIRVGVKDVLDYLGLEIDITKLVSFMSLIGCQIMIKESDYVTVKVPSYRKDLNHYYDLVEEVARLVGYENLPKQDLVFNPLNVEDRALTRHYQLVESLVCRGYQELYSLSLQSQNHAELFAKSDTLIQLDNPLSEEYAVMRPSILSSLVLQIKQCLNHFIKSGKLVEVGNCFQKPFFESNRVGLATFGDKDFPENNNNTFSKIKQDVFAMLHRLKPGLAIKYLPEHKSQKVPLGWHPNQTALIIANDELIGYVGKLHPQLQQNIAVEVFVAELDLDVLDKQNTEFNKPQAQSKFPPSNRDLSFWVNEATCAGLLKDQILALSELITEVVVVDDYFSEQDEQRSLTFRLIFQSFSKTLKDKEIDKIIENTVAILAKDGIKLRDH